MDTLNWKKISLYLTLAYFFSWSIFYLCKRLLGQEDHLGTTVAVLLFMLGPAAAALAVQHLIYKKSLKCLGLSFDKSRARHYITIVFVFLGITGCTFGIIYLLGNVLEVKQFGKLDFSAQHFNNRLWALLPPSLEIREADLPVLPPIPLFFLILIQGIVAGATFNIPLMLGEELGWRGLLYHETKQMGLVKSAVFTGFFWGLWHTPLILEGLNYPDYPKYGVALMAVFTMTISPLFSYARLATNSILGPCLLHGCINATGAVYLLYIRDGSELYATLTGASGIAGVILVTAALFFKDARPIAFFNEKYTKNSI